MFRKIIATLCLATLFTAVWAQDGDKDINIKIKPQDSGFSVNWSTNMRYGSGANRVQGSGNVVERERTVAGFTKVRVVGPMDVKLRAAQSDRVRISADDNIEPMIETRLEGDTLVIDIIKGSNFSTRNKVLIAVDFKKLEGVALTGSGDVHVDRVAGERFSASVSGSGDLRVGELEVSQFSGSVSGSGDVRAAGRAQTQSWSIAGSGDVWAERLNGQSIKVNIAGSGDARVGTAQTLDVAIAGSGDVTYSGSPTVKKAIAGSGSVAAR